MPTRGRARGINRYSVPVACLVALCYYEKMSEVFADNNTSINQERYVWLEGYVKKIEKEHPGISYGLETEDNSWRIFSKRGTLLIKVSFDLENKYIVYQYITDSKGNLKEEMTKELKDLLDLIPQLEAIDAFNR